MDNYCRNKQLEYQRKGLLGRREVTPNMFEPESKKIKTNNEDIIELKCSFIRASYINDIDLPKSKLINWCMKNKKDKPVYETINEDKLFKSIVMIDGKKYSSTFW